MADEMTKSAKKRAAKKARDEAHAAAEAEPAPAAAAPKAKAKAAAGGYPEAKAKAKADPAPKAKAKAAAPAPAGAEPKAKAKGEPKSKAKAKAAPKEEPKPEPSEFGYVSTWEPEVDDGSGPAWEVSTGKTAKEQRRLAKQEEAKKLAAAQPKAVNDRYVPGLAGAPNTIPGMAPAGTISKNSVNQSVTATAAAAAAAAKAAAAATATTEVAAPASIQSIRVPENKIGVVIGPKGAMIKLIQEKTGTKIDTAGEDFTISGSGEGVATAYGAINDLILKGYTPLSYEDFAENFVMVPGCNFPDLIGKKGVIVQTIKSELGVEVTFPPTSGTKGQDMKKYKVTIAGKKEGVEKCKEVINDIVCYGHHEITHPGEGHEEVEVPEWCYAAIIGKKGCELRHLQNSYKVRCIIPREGSAIQNVVLVGETHQLPRARAYIEKAVYNFQNQVKGRDRSDGGAEDPWGDEEPVEDWMKQYMYKR